MLRERTDAEPGLVAFYDIRPGKGAHGSILSTPEPARGIFAIHVDRKQDVMKQTTSEPVTHGWPVGLTSTPAARGAVSNVNYLCITHLTDMNYTHVTKRVELLGRLKMREWKKWKMRYGKNAW